MSMPLSIAPPPAAPVAVPYLPDASMEVNMFSTDCAVSDVQLFHARLNTPFDILDGFQLLNTPAEKSVSAVHPYQARYMLVTEGSSALKLASDRQLRNEATRLPAVGNGVLNEVSPLDCHALLKFTLLALVPSFAPAGND